MNQVSKPFLLLAFAILLIACTTVPLTGRKQTNFVNDVEMQQMATKSYQDFLANKTTKVVSNSAQSKKVKEIGAKIKNAVTLYMNQNGYGNQIKDYQWEFNLVESKEVNAWCMPGGKVAVYTGILPVTQTDAGLATVMGHEIAHAVARHANERYSQAMLAQGLGALIGSAATKSEQSYDVFQKVFGIGAQAGVLLPNSRKQESEADRLGLTFMAMAGYRPEMAVDFWQRMAAQSKSGKQPEFLSTHPSDEKRIEDIKKYLPEAQKFYQGK
jgi:metalloendopeptidase OMA1, mitochondrial